MPKKLIVAFAVFSSVALFAAGNSDKEGKKLDEQVKKISLIASDSNGRRVINRCMARQLGVGRNQLVEERRTTQLVYGQIFAAHEIASQTNSSFADVAKEMTAGKSARDIGVEKNADLKKIAKDARKVNSKVDEELSRVAAGEISEVALDQAEGYNPEVDVQAADTSSFNPAELALGAQLVKEPPELAERRINVESQSALVKGTLGAGSNAGAIGAAAASKAGGPPSGLPH